MPDQNDVGAAYLAALKRSTLSPATAGAVAGTGAGARSAAPLDTRSIQPSPIPPVAAGRTGPISEKRRSPRYRCQGSTQLRDVKTGVAIWATFSDISLHGCYVEAASGYPVGCTLKLLIEVNGFRVEAVGEVRITYPGLGMGISFTQVSDENRARLLELVRSLSQPSVIMGVRPALEPAASVLSAMPAVQNPTAAFLAIQKFFEDRQVMSRDEFGRILRKSQQ
jgi:hypothetical protein